MSTSRLVKLAALKRSVQLQTWRREANRLFDEIHRLDQRIDQVERLEDIYRDHLAGQSVSANELISIRVINAQLRERKDIDKNRRELLDVERVRVSGVLAEKRREIDNLEDEAKRRKRLEAEEKLERLQSLMPARRN